MIFVPGWTNSPVTERSPSIVRSGQRGYLATRILRQKGFSASNIGGGYKTYKLFPPSADRCR